MSQSLSGNDFQRGVSPLAKITLVLILFLTLAVGFLLADRFSRQRLAGLPRDVTPRGDLGMGEKATIALFQNTSDSVVHITSFADAPGYSGVSQNGMGSGFVWDEQGHIVTNYHVIEGAQRHIVTFADQTTVEADMVGKAPHKDLALLKVSVESQDLKPIAIGESANLQVGQSVIAIGNPFGLDQTLTTGIVSGLGRQIRSTTDRKISDVIQTDAAINPGNSGGPLLDSAGRLIGVNTAIASTSGSSGGVGFAIPVDTVRRVIPQLIQHQRVTTPALGIVPVAQEQLTRRNGMTGVLVQYVVEDGPAHVAGILPFRRGPRGHILYGDLIVAIDGKSVTRIDELHAILDTYEVGDTVKVQIVRMPSSALAEDGVIEVMLGDAG